MAIIEFVSGILSAKAAAAAAAGLVAAGGAITAAGVTEHLPSPLQETFDAIVQAEDESEPAETTLGEGNDTTVETDTAPDWDDRGVAADVLRELSGGLLPTDEGFGQAVAERARERAQNHAQLPEVAEEAREQGADGAGEPAGSAETGEEARDAHAPETPATGEEARDAYAPEDTPANGDVPPAGPEAGQEAQDTYRPAGR
jgi:hypothetical protein